MTALEALHQWPLAVWMRTSAFAYPVLETLHIIFFSVVFGTILMVDVGVLRRRTDIHTWMASLLPWTLAAFVLAAAAGLLMFIGRARDLIANDAFVLKIVLLSLAGVNAAIFHARGPVQVNSRATRAQAVLSIVLWLAIIACGRWIAYV